ncbi:MAG: DUF4105 domain-containing protein [Longimicrobiales bacterium]|nr:DUF4105 domain-containing protein [Longimicrobiales bacterium]
MKRRLPTPLTVSLTAALLAAPTAAFAQRAAAPIQPAAQEPGARPAPVTGPAADSLRVFLLTFGPGAEVWERFGHNAIWIHDPVAGTDIAYHWGLFDMSEQGFMLEFLQGRMVYSMGSVGTDRLMDAYRRAGRDATVQELALTVAEAESLQQFVQWNVRPENRRYRYDYFRDNCSTRVRDALDDALGGALRATLADRPAGHTYRSQAVALTAEDVLLTSGMDLGLGPLADQPITRWELAFIPMRLRDDLRTLTVRRGGRAVPMVVDERELDALGPEDPSRAGPPSPARRTLGHLLAGLLAAGAVVGLARLARRGSGTGRAAGWALAAVGGLWGLVAGALGTIVFALWAFTDHEFAWRNENLLQVNPLALGLAVLAPVALGAGKAVGVARKLALTLLGLSLLGLLVHPLPVTPQANLAIIVAALPIHAAMAYALVSSSPSSSSGIAHSS